MQREAWRAIGVGALSSKGLVVIRKRRRKRRRRRRPPLLTPPRREKEKSAKIVCPKMDDVGGTGENQGLCQSEREGAGWALQLPWAWGG